MIRSIMKDSNRNDKEDWRETHDRDDRDFGEGTDGSVKKQRQDEDQGRDKDDPLSRDLKAENVQNDRDRVPDDDHICDTGSCRLEKDDAVQHVES